MPNGGKISSRVKDTPSRVIRNPIRLGKPFHGLRRWLFAAGSLRSTANVAFWVGPRRFVYPPNGSGNSERRGAIHGENIPGRAVGIRRDAIATKAGSAAHPP